jgi:flagellar protein FliO/FliZ
LAVFLWAVGDSVEKMVERGNGQAGTPVSPDLGGGNSLALVGGLLQLIVVVLLIAALVYLLIKFLGTKANGSRLHPYMRTVSVHPVSANRSIQMISLEDRIYIVGVGDDITLLDVISDEQLVEQIRNNAPAPVKRDLPAWLAKWVPGQKGESVYEIETPAFHDTLQSKLQELKDRRKNIQEWEPDNK